MTTDSTVTVTQAQARLPKLVKKDSFAIARHGQVMGFYLCKDRIEALVESMELLSNPEFSKAVKSLTEKKPKLFTVRQIDAAMSR